jgi:hypothetical protein
MCVAGIPQLLMAVCFGAKSGIASSEKVDNHFGLELLFKKRKNY